MPRFLNFLGWALIVTSVAVLIISILGSTDVMEGLKGAVPAGLLIALAGHLFTQSKGIGESAEKRSMFHLDSCVEAYEEARALLADGGNCRATWIAAGRALVHAKELSKAVTIDSHLRVLELHRLKYRSFFSSRLENSASFFYGVDDSSMPVDEAAAASTAREERLGRTITSTLKSLSEESIHAVWEAAQWPLEYEDPLDRGFSSGERGKLFVLYPGLHEYLEHKEQWHSASGRLFPREDDAR